VTDRGIRFPRLPFNPVIDADVFGALLRDRSGTTWLTD